jgi:hypothetical protein
VRLASRLIVFALAAALCAAAAPASGPLVVKASPVAQPCVRAAASAFGSAVAVMTAEIGPPESVAGADVVVAAEEELTRVIEGGASLPDVEADLGAIPWVLVAPAGSAAPDGLRALARTSGAVRVPQGVIARHARASLEGLEPGRVRSVRADAAALAPRAGELALVPLSLAGRGGGAATRVAPVKIVGVVSRGSVRADAARAFVEYLSGGKGQATFLACGRETAK